MVAARRPPRRWTLAVLLLAFLALAAVGSVSRFYTDLLWFREIDKTSLFWGMLRTKAFIGLLAGLGTAAIVGVNLWMVERLAPRYGLTVVARPQVERARAVLSPYLRPLRIGIAAFLGLVVGLQASGLWQTFLLWRNRVPFGQRDALFNRDVGFYVFELPFQRAVFGWLFTTLVLTTLLVAAGHYIPAGSARRPRPTASPPRPSPICASCSASSWPSRPGATGWTSTSCCSHPAAWSRAPPTPTSRPSCPPWRCCSGSP